MGRSSQCSKYVNEFDEGEWLGKGDYGVVYKCTNKLDAMTYAVKKIPFSPREEPTVLWEVRLLCQAQHKNFVRYYQEWIEDEAVDLSLSEAGSDVLNTSYAAKTLYLLMELCPSTLKQKMEEGFDRKKAWNYFKGVVKGLFHVHAKRIIHQDLTRGSIFVDEADNSKMGDFGLGLTLLEMMYPMETTMERNDLFKRIREREDDDQLPLLDNWEYEERVDRLLVSLLKNYPFQRPSASQILKMIADR